tara:strand:- start:2951 stop:3352 length:402 start_codon:yes stop_codon:yes gene_type:complete
MNLKFTTKLTNIKNYTFFNFEEIDKDYDMFEDLNIVVEWEAWINVREYGIKDITPVVKAIRIDGMYSTTNDIEKNYELSIKDDIDFTYVEPYNKEWKLIKIDYESSDYGALEINEITLDFKDKTIEVQFNEYE